MIDLVFRCFLARNKTRNQNSGKMFILNLTDFRLSQLLLRTSDFYFVFHAITCRLDKQFCWYRQKREPGQLSRYSDSLQAGRSWDRIPVGSRFSAYVQTGSEAHPATYTMSTGSFLGVKRPGSGVDHPPSSSAEIKERVELYLCSPSGPSWPVIG